MLVLCNIAGNLSVWLVFADNPGSRPSRTLKDMLKICLSSHKVGCFCKNVSETEIHVGSLPGLATARTDCWLGSHCSRLMEQANRAPESLCAALPPKTHTCPTLWKLLISVAGPGRLPDCHKPCTQRLGFILLWPEGRGFGTLFSAI